MCTPGNTVCVEDYRNPDRRYIVEIGAASGQFPRVIRRETDPGVKSRGYFVQQTLGLLARQSAVVVVYTDSNSILLSLAGKVYDVTNPQTQCRIGAVFPFAKRFSLMLGSATLLECYYWIFERSDCWPERDIFAMVVRIARDEVTKKRSLRIWNEISEGRDITRADFLRSLEEVTISGAE
jgi:hypothetical protein